MAYGFGSLGTSGDRINTTLQVDSTNRSTWIWFNVVSTGASMALWDQSNNSGRSNFVRVSVGAFIDWFAAFDGGTNGLWRTDTTVTTDTWHGIGWSYVNSSNANDPIAYYDGVKKTVGAGLTEVNTPTGNFFPADSFAGLYIGNRADFTQTVDGSIAEVAVWDGILTDAEFAELYAGYAPALIRPESLTVYMPLVRDNIDPKRGGSPGLVGPPLVQPHCRICYRKKTKRS